MFHKQAVCRMGPKMEKGLIDKCKQYRHVTLPFIDRVETLPLLFKEQRQKYVNKGLLDCHVTPHKDPNRHTNFPKVLIIYVSLHHQS